MNFQILQSVIEELSSMLASSHVERVYEGAAKHLIIIVRKNRQKYILLISPDRSLPRLHLLGQKPAAAASLHPFTLFLKSRVTRGTIAGIGLLNQDRVVELVFSRNGTGYRLIFEVTGSTSNLILTDQDGSILAVYYPASITNSSSRPLLPGTKYELPPKKDFSNDRNSVVKGSVPLSTADKTGSGSWNRQAEVSFDRLLKQKEFESSRGALHTVAKKLFSKTKRRLQALDLDAKTADQADEYKRAGDLILANLNRVRNGMSEVELSGPDGLLFRISLDPKQSPTGNAERYFKKYKKAKAARAIIRDRIIQATEEISLLGTLMSELDRAEDRSAVDRVRSNLVEQGYIRMNEKREKPGKLPAPGSFRKFFFNGWEVIVGKSAAGNDYITTKIARPDDLWLHAEGLAGSHVVVRNPEKKDIPPEVLAKAASLAAFYSKGRDSGKVPVAYTPARFVKKPKGAKPGLALLLRRKTIMAVPKALSDGSAE